MPTDNSHSGREDIDDVVDGLIDGIKTDDSLSETSEMEMDMDDRLTLQYFDQYSKEQFIFHHSKWPSFKIYRICIVCFRM